MEVKNGLISKRFKAEQLKRLEMHAKSGAEAPSGEYECQTAADKFILHNRRSGTCLNHNIW
jgi:hypothetical protein